MELSICPRAFRYIPISTAAILLLSSTLASAQNIETGKTFSFCLSPSSVEATVATKEERDQYPKCARWSNFYRTSATVETREFVMTNCGGREKRPVNAFALAVINRFRNDAKLPAMKSAPSTRDLSDRFAQLGMRELNQGESRAGSVILWKGQPDGMVGLVTADESDPGSPPDLAKLTVLYPGTNPDPEQCGTLKSADGATIAASLNTDEASRRTPLFLTLAVPRLFWNYWVEVDSAMEAERLEQPESLQLDNWYRFRLSFSSLEYDQWRPGGTNRRAALTPDRARLAVPDFKGRKYNLLILPTGPLGDSTLLKTDFTLDTRQLQDSLVHPPSGDVPLYKDMAKAHEALVQSNGTRGVTVQFNMKSGGECGAFAVIVTDAATGELVSGWSRPVRAENSLIPVNGCGDITTASRRMDLIALFDYVLDDGVVARLAFLEFANNQTIGMFVDLRGDVPETLVWVLAAKSLKRELSRMTREIDKEIGNPDFSISRWAQEMRDGLLFSCRQDDGCAGTEVRERLFSIAAGANDDTIIQASLRDTGNARFYLPAQLIALKDGTLLGEKLGVVQPLPRPTGKLPAGNNCVRDWSGGLVVTDADDVLKPEWRAGWPQKLNAQPAHYTISRFYGGIVDLRSYFWDSSAKPTAPEALVVLAHHGPDGISNSAADSPNREWIRIYQLRRQFDSRSFAVLALCSVGAVSDSDLDNSLVLDTLNASKIRATIVSPFNIPFQLAKSFIDHFQSQVLAQPANTSLRALFRKAKADLRANPRKEEDQKGLQAAIETFMLLGDGNVQVCKP